MQCFPGAFESQKSLLHCGCQRNRGPSCNSLELFNLIEEKGEKDKHHTQKRAVERTGNCQEELDPEGSQFLRCPSH